jgi:proline iminopeptidase
MDSHSGSIEAGGFQLRYQIEGMGTPTIVIGSARKEPRLFSPHLREHLRLVFLDHRGFAAPPQPNRPDVICARDLGRRHRARTPRSWA